MVLFLSERLNKLIAMAEPINLFADIGADHAFLSIGMIEKQKAKKAIASDISAKSLEKAKKYIDFAKYNDLIELRVGDGLSILKDNEAQGIAICGMGGETISKIITDSEKKLLNVAYLLLCPQSNEYMLRQTIFEIGFEISDEEIIFENNMFYQLIYAKKGNPKLLSELELEFGHINIKKATDNLFLLVNKKLKDALNMRNTAVRGKSDKAKEAVKLAEKRIEEYERLLKNA